MGGGPIGSRTPTGRPSAASVAGPSVGHGKDIRARIVQGRFRGELESFARVAEAKHVQTPRVLGQRTNTQHRSHVRVVRISPLATVSRFA